MTPSTPGHAEARFLVTGATGMVGRRIVDRLLSSGNAVATLGRRAHGAEQRFFAWNAAEAGSLEVAAAWKPDIIVHAAAMTDVDRCEREPALAERINAHATGEIAGLAMRTGARLVYCSTDAVFEGSRGWYTDQDRPDPVNVYGRTKLEGERRALEAPQALVVRFNVVGPAKLTSWILESAAGGIPIRVFTDVVFNPLEAGDLAGCLRTLAATAVSGVRHLAPSGEAISKAEYARRLVEYAGLSARAHLTPIRLAESNPTVPRPLDTSLRPSTDLAGLLDVPPVDAVIRRLATSFVPLRG